MKSIRILFVFIIVGGLAGCSPAQTVANAGIDMLFGDDDEDCEKEGLTKKERKRRKRFNQRRERKKRRCYKIEPRREDVDYEAIFDDKG